MMRPIDVHRTVRLTSGFSLVELLVSVVVGLLAIMFATRLMLGGEQNRSAAVGGSDAMQNGMLALFSIQNDAGQAGWGLNDDLINGCNTLMADTQGFTLAGATRNGAAITPLTAAVIVNGGTRSDTLTLYSGSGPAGVGSVRVYNNYASGTTIGTDTQKPFAFNQGDVIVVAPEPVGGNCSLAQLSSEPTTQNLAIATGNAFRFNSGGLAAGAYTAGQARVFNLGRGAKLAFHTWSVSNGVLLLRATDLAGTARTPQSVIGNVVAIKAQYGFDTRAAAVFDPKQGMQVTRWSNTMIDADGDTVAGDPGDFQRVAALRIAVVARSGMPDKPTAGGTTCAATPAAQTVFNTAAPAGVAAVPVTVALDATGETVSWTCYRYRVFETIVPIRNAGWRP